MESYSSLKRATKMLTKALDNPNYSYDQYVQILKKRHQVKKLRENLKNYDRATRGFGYDINETTIEDSISEVNSSDSRSGEDDGVRSESEQSEQSGES